MTLIFVSRLTNILKDRGMTVDALYELMAASEDTYIGFQSLSRIASRTQPVISGSTKLETLQKIATTLNVKVDDLYTVQKLDIK